MLDPPELEAIYREPSDDERLGAVLSLVSTRTGAIDLALLHRSSPIGLGPVTVRAGVRWVRAAPDLAALEVWCRAGHTRALVPGDGLCELLVDPPVGARWWGLPLERDGVPQAIAVLACAAEPAPETLAQAQALLVAALRKEHHLRVRRHLVAAVEQSADPLELTDRQATLFWVNQAWERYTGYRSEEVIGRGLASLLRDPISPPHDEAFYAFTMETIAQGQAWTGAMVSRSKSGERLYQEVTVSPVIGDQGQPLNLATRRDIQHRQRREVALMQAHQEIRLVLASLPDGVAVLKEGRVYFANEALSRIVARPHDELINQPFEALLPPGERLELGRPSDGPQEVRLLRPDGSARYCLISAAGMVSFEGRPASVLIARDTSESKIAQEQLALADRLSAMGTMAAGVAHEINNPLAYVLGNLELLREATAPRLPPSERDALLEALEGVQRIRRIVSDLKSFTRRDAEPRLESVDASAVLTAACNIVLNEIRHRARLVHDFEQGLAVLGEEGRLLQVLVNLLLNAAHAIPEGDGRAHEIRVASRRLGDGRVALSVEDTGRGIPAEMMPRVFEPFFTTKARGVGSGLGLPISQRIIRELDGEIRLSSTEGVGTKVTVELAEAAPPPKRRDARRPTSSPGLASGRLLLVDDEPGVLRALTRILRDHQVRAASSGFEALGLLEADAEVDLIVCDVMMPGMTGVELYEVAQSRWPRLSERFVFTTGGTFTDRTSRFFEQQRRRLDKPFDPERVLAIVRDVLGAAPGSKGG